MKELIDRILGNPKTTILGGVIVAVYGAGSSLEASGVEPWGAITKGVAGILVLVGLALARDGGKKEP